MVPAARVNVFVVPIDKGKSSHGPGPLHSAGNEDRDAHTCPWSSIDGHKPVDMRMLCSLMEVLLISAKDLWL